MWPQHFTADELFDALAPPKRTNFTGEYQRFLCSDFAAHIPPNKMVCALEWAKTHLTKAHVEHGPLSTAALSVVAAGMKSFHDAEVCGRIARILVKLATVPIPDLQVMSKLSANCEARNAIGRLAIRTVPDPGTVHRLIHYGLFDESDVTFFLNELESTSASDQRERIAFLIAALLYGVPWFDFALIERVFAVAAANPILAAALKPVVCPVELGSEDAEYQKAQYKSAQRNQNPKSRPAISPNIDDAIAGVDRGETIAFLRICGCLPGTSWSREFPDRSWSPAEEVLPGWERLTSVAQAKVIRSAEMYLNGCCPANESWIDISEHWYIVACGYWALRVLVQTVPEVLEKLTPDVWYAWMPSVFGDPYVPGDLDAVQTVLLKTAYLRAPTRFREVLARLIDAQQKTRADIFILDRTTPVWGDEVAALLLSRLREGSLSSRAFRQILHSLLLGGNLAARQIATDIVASAASAAAEDLDKPIEAALELVNHEPSGTWKLLWPVAQKNTELAERLLSRYAVDPYSAESTKLIDGLTENQLAEVQIWLALRKSEQIESDQIAGSSPRIGGFAGIPSNRGWYWLSVVVMNALIQRGTPESIEAIRRIDDKFPDEKLKRVEQAAREVIREKTWKPLSPAELIDFVCAPRAPAGEIGEKPVSKPAAAPPVTDTLRQFKKAGEMWFLQFDGVGIPVTVRDRVGMAYIALLLRSPGSSFRCLELQAIVRGGPKRTPRMDHGDKAALHDDESCEYEILDPRTRREYKERLKSIEQELDKADANIDIGKVERLRREKDAIIEEIKALTTIHGSGRKFSTPREKARKAVSRAISNAFDAIERRHELLAQHRGAESRRAHPAATTVTALHGKRNS